MKGRRTALPRHRTLTAMLDLELRSTLGDRAHGSSPACRIRGSLPAKSAGAVLADDRMAAPVAIDVVADLVAKSLVSVRAGAGVPFFRLLDTTRAYALGKLEESGERRTFAGQHARHHLGLLQAAAIDWEALAASDWNALYGYLIDDVRAALDWSMSEAGDARTGVALTVAAVPLWFVLSLISECGERAERALATPSRAQRPVDEMHLQAALAWSLMQTQGFVLATRAAWSRVLSLAEDVCDVDHQLRALWGLLGRQAQRRRTAACAVSCHAICSHRGVAARLRPARRRPHGRIHTASCRRPNGGQGISLPNGRKL